MRRALRALAVAGPAATAGAGILTVNLLTLDNTRVVGNTPDDCVC